MVTKTSSEFFLDKLTSRLRSVVAVFNSRRQGQSAWDRFIPMDREQAEAFLKRDLPPQTGVTITLDENGAGEIYFRCEGVLEETRPFDLGMYEVYSGNMQVKKQGRGLGRLLMRNEIEFFKRCGVKKFNILASSTAGGYTWARLGFLPDNIEASAFNMYARLAIQTNLSAITPFMTEEEKEDLQKLCQIKAPHDMWRIADSVIDINPRLTEAFNNEAGLQATAPYFQDLYNVRSLKSYFSINPTSRYIKDRVQEGKPVLAGRVLLAGTEWHAHLDFDNKEQMQRVSRYVGGLQGFSAT